MLIASCSDDSTVRVWNAATGKPVHTYRGHTKAVESLDWSPNGKLIVSGGQDETVQVWEAVTGTFIYSYKDQTESERASRCTVQAKCADAGSAQETGQISGARSADAAAPAPPDVVVRGVRGVAWAPNGNYTASGGYNRTVTVSSSEGWGTN
jgi:WD40 repeat protein